MPFRSTPSTPVASGALLAALLALFAGVGEAIYFQVVEGQSKCFIEEVPGDTLVLATYKNPDFVEWGKPDFTGTVREHFE